MGFFSQIPENQLMKVLKKFDFVDFANFTRCSSESRNMASQMKHRLHLEVEEIMDDTFIINREIFSFDKIKDEPIRLVSEQIVLHTDSRNHDCARLIKFMEETQSSAKKLRISVTEESDFDIKTLKKLMEVSKVETFTLRCSSKDFMNRPKINFNRISHNPIEESDFALFEVYKSDPGVMSACALNNLFKEWLNGKMEIEILQWLVDGHSSLDYSEVFKDLTFSEFWPSEKEDALLLNTFKLKRMKAKRIDFIRREDGLLLFVVSRGDGISARNVPSVDGLVWWINHF